MLIGRIYIAPEPKTEYKDKLHRIPTFVMRILLFLSFIFYGWHTLEASVSALPYMMGNLSTSYDFALIIGHIADGAVALLVFELVGSLYYSFIRPSCPNVPLSKSAFMVYLRGAYLIRNLIAGVVKFLVYERDLYVFAYDSLINLAITVLVLSVTLAYVSIKYVPISLRANFLKSVSLPFIVYEAVMTVMVLL